MAGVTHEIRGKHHNLTAVVVSREEKNVTKLSNTIRGFTNPLSQDGADLFNLVTKVVLPEEVKDDLCNQSDIGLKLFTAFLNERIQTGKENLWSPMKKSLESVSLQPGERLVRQHTQECGASSKHPRRS